MSRSPAGAGPQPGREIHPLDSAGLTCRFCAAPLRDTFADLGMTPLCQKQVKPSQLNDAETYYPLHAFVCASCWLVQLGEYASPREIFADEYAYFSSYSDTWLAHAKAYTGKMRGLLGLGASSLVVEIASNDGYLLQYFVEAGVPVLGVEPAANVAEAARAKGVPTEVRFFGTESARALRDAHGGADLLLGNNVLAHVPDLNDFVAGMCIMLNPAGVITMEFPHLVQLVNQNQFDTIYHEHFSYFSFTTVEKVFAAHGITLFDVEELPTHGGSLRIYGRHCDDRPVSDRVRELKAREEAWGVRSLARYHAFNEQLRATKRNILSFLIEARGAGKRVAGYGAPGKGNTLLNYCGIGTDFLEFTVDRSPHKQNTFTPGMRIPIYAPERIRLARPDYLFILPWNLKEEIMRQTAYIREWGGRWVVPIPEVTVHE
ncbi:MAG TPA: class I SAM-dependent methyltransferase [Candidatus Krumholzibacteria bacterium]|nr:class I SAM-dependent methyltransferase [Candidatus Krumholzibacteria bacterium]